MVKVKCKKCGYEYETYHKDKSLKLTPQEMAEIYPKWSIKLALKLKE